MTTMNSVSKRNKSMTHLIRKLNNIASAAGLSSIVLSHHRGEPCPSTCLCTTSFTKLLLQMLGCLRPVGTLVVISRWLEVNSREVLSKDDLEGLGLLTPTFDGRLAVQEAFNNIGYIEVMRPLY